MKSSELAYDEGGARQVTVLSHMTSEARDLRGRLLQVWPYCGLHLLRALDFKSRDS